MTSWVRGINWRSDSERGGRESAAEKSRAGNKSGFRECLTPIGGIAGNTIIIQVFLSTSLPRINYRYPESQHGSDNSQNS
jgi:hypothetical protein